MMSPSCNSNAARAAARLCSLSRKTDGGPTPGITFSSNSRRTSSHNALMHPFSTFSLLVHLRQFAVARPCIYPGRPSCGVGGAGLLGPGGLRFGRRGYSEHRMLLVAGLPPVLYRPASAPHTSPADEGDSISTLISNDRFSTIPPLTAAPRWRVGWLGSLSFPSAGVDPHDLTICQIAPISEAAGELRCLRRPIALAPGPHRRQPTSPMPRRRPPPAVSMGARNQSRRGQLPAAVPPQLSNVGYGS